MKRVILMIVAALLVTLCAVPVFAGDNRFIVTRKTVEDKRTGLIWTRAGDLDKLDWNGASDLVKKLNEKEFAGAKDWRLPSREELGTLTSYAVKAGFIGGTQADAPYQLFNKIGFNDVQPCWYWTSSINDNNTDSAWVVGMHNGTLRRESKESDFCVWPVRGGKRDLQMTE